MKQKLVLILVTFINIICHCAQAQWQLTGNAISSTDFLGSTNARPLVFKTNNSQSGLIDYDADKANTAFGYEALLSLSTGYNNTAVGYQALYSNTSAHRNDAFGYKAMYNNTTGNANSAFGTLSLYNNTTGINNVGLGLYALVSNTTGSYNVASGFALYGNTTGSYNTAYGFHALRSNTTVNNLTAIGFNALYSNTSGTENTALGYRALYSNTSGAGNTANGYQALYTNSSGEFNTATGYHTLYSNTTASYNTAYGYSALKNNTTGEWNLGVGSFSLYSNSTGHNNIAVGYSSLYSNTDGADNAAVGQLALTSNTTGQANTAIGLIALWRNTTGAANSAVGYAALSQNSTGDINTAIGYAADANAGNYSNTTMIGASALGTGSNMVRLGNNSVTSIGGYADWTNISDRRVKRNIKMNVPGLNFINKLNPVTYNLDLTASDIIVQPPMRTDKNGNTIQASDEEIKARKQKEQIVYTGFVAQEVENTAKSIGYNFSGVDVPKNDKDLYGLRYSEFVVPLVKAVQELSNENDQLKTQLNELSKRIEALELSKNTTTLQTEIVSEVARLEQNTPNPFNNNTVIKYNIPLSTNNAQIIISGINGIVLKTILLTNKGFANVVIDAGTLMPGNYFYSLIVDGKRIDSKQMVLTK